MRLTYLPAAVAAWAPAVFVSLRTSTNQRQLGFAKLASHLQRRGTNWQRQGALDSWREVPPELGKGNAINPALEVNI